MAERHREAGRLKRSCGWTAKPSCAFVVADRGALRFENPATSGIEPMPKPALCAASPKRTAPAQSGWLVWAARSAGACSRSAARACLSPRRPSNCPARACVHPPAREAQGDRPRRARRARHEHTAQHPPQRTARSLPSSRPTAPRVCPTAVPAGTPIELTTLPLWEGARTSDGGRDDACRHRGSGRNSRAA